MTMEPQSRPRVFLPIAGIGTEVDHLFELHARCQGLIDGLEPQALGHELLGHSIQSLVAHMIWAEAKWVAAINDDEPPVLADIAALEVFTATHLAGLEFGSAFLGPRFDSVGQMLRHIQWHWSYHTAQVSFIRKAAGSAYIWT